MGKIKAVIFDLDDTLLYSFMDKEKQGQVMPEVYEVLQVLQQIAPALFLGVATNRAGGPWHEAQALLYPERPNPYPTAEQDAQAVIDAANNLVFLDRAQWAISLWDGRIATALEKRVKELEPEDPHDPASAPIDYDEFDPEKIIKGVAERMRKLIVERRRLNCWISSRQEWRKPRPEMLLTFCHAWDVSPHEVIFCGDMDGTKRDRNHQPLDSDLQAARNAGMIFVRASDIKSLPDMVDDGPIFA